MQVLLVTNMIFSFAMPVVYMFIGAYILRNTSSVSMVVTYQLASYTGIPLTFLLSGYLMRHVQIKRLYSLGMLLCGVSMTIMMAIPKLDLKGVGIAGLVLGMGFGLFWSSRDFLALSSTNDGNRNYYFGLDSFFAITTSLIVPIFVGWFLEGSAHWLGDINRGYHVVTGGVFAVAILASLVVHRGVFVNPPLTRFVFFRFHPLWRRFLILAVLKGLAQGYIVTAPAMLVTRFLGKEGVLGSVQGVGVLFSAGLVYLIGRNIRPGQRILVFALGLSLFALGGIANAALFNSTGVVIFMICLLLGSPLLDFAYAPIALRVVDTVSALEGRNQFSYIFNHEFGLFVGRLAGCGLFIVLANEVSDVVALRYALMVIGLLQLLSIPVARWVESHSNMALAPTKKEEPAAAVLSCQ
jgi:YQGE family putative transporter